jgi:hypothetical protein
MKGISKKRVFITECGALSEFREWRIALTIH